MSKSRLFSGKIKKLSGNKLTADRYDYLDSSQAEPDLGSPDRVGSVLIGSTNSNVRTWSDLLTIEGPTIRIRSTLTNIGFYTPNALVVDGGIGVAGDLNILGKALINNVEVLTTQSGLTSQFGQSIIDLVLRLTTSTNATSTSTGGLIVSGGVGINKDVWIGGTTFAGNVYSNGSLVGSSTGTTTTFLINNFTQSTSTNSGALVVKGGVGIGGNLYVTGDIVDITGRIIGSGTTGTTSTFVISNTSSSTSTNSGALVVTGGAGIGGALFVNTTSYIAGSQIITTATVNIYATKTTITAGTDTAVNTSTGEVTIWNTSTLESVTSRGNSTTNAIVINNITGATSTTTGALIVAGGVGIGGDVYIAGKIVAQELEIQYTTITTTLVVTDDIISTYNTTNSTSPTTGALQVAGGAGIGGNLWLGGNLNIAEGSTLSIGNTQLFSTTITAGTDTAVNTSTGNITIWNTSTLQTITDRGSSTSNAISISNATSANNSITGALIVAGGVGIGGDLQVGGDIYTKGQKVLTTSTVNDYANQTSIIAGTDTAVSTSTGAVTIWNTSTLQTITSRGSSTTQAISISNTTSSTSTVTGALVVAGGVGIGGSVNIAGGLVADGINLLNQNQHIWYVDPVIGVNDHTKNGHPLSPARTIKYALSYADSGDTVFIQPGIYYEEFPLTIAEGVSVRGAGLREVIIYPTTATNTATAFLLNGEALVSDFTVGGFFKPGYAFEFAPNAVTTTKSPYIERFSVITKGSVTSAGDPYGFNSNNAGGGAKIDGSRVLTTSAQASMMFNEATFIVPNATGLYMTNGARAEVINTFFYFADKAIHAVSSSTGYAGAGKTKLKLGGVSGTLTVGDTLFYKTLGGTTLASGTMAGVDGSYVYITGAQWGFDTPSTRTAKIISVLGNTSIDASVKKYGTGSAKFDGVGDALTIPSNVDFAFGTGTFTIECWVRLNSLTGTQILFDFRNDGTTPSSYAPIITLISGTLNYQTIAGNRIVGTTLTTSTWYHVALSRSGSSTKLFLDGTQVGSTYTDTNNYIQGPLTIGSQYNGSNSVNGYIDDIRISKGLARYTTSPFVAPTSALVGDEYTVLMLHADGVLESTVFYDENTIPQIIYSTGTTYATATSIQLADYHQFGAEIRSLGSAAIFGNSGVTADGTGTDIKLIAFNVSHIGAGKDSSDDNSLVVQANEIIQINGGKVYFQTVDQSGDFRVGNSFLVNQRTGDVSFGEAKVNLSNLGQLTVTDGSNNAVILPTSVSVGSLILSGGSLVTNSGNLTLDPAGTLTTINSDVQINGNVVGNLNVTGNIVGGGVRSTTTSTAPVVATVGDIWYNTTNDRMYRYTTANNTHAFWLDFTGQKMRYLKNRISITPPTTIEYLVVGGGGGGGYGGMYAGGGGGGGLLTNLGSFGYAVSTGTTYTITVGAGGLVGASSGSRGSNGDYSQFNTIIASGGGGGGTVGNGSGNSGGSGGGGASISGGSIGGGATSGQGNIGGTVGNASAPYLGGGGGGAGGQGSNGGGTSNAGNGNGGVGLALNISGSATYYAGGGGGGLYYYPANSGTQGGQGGQGGGGRGESSDVPGTAGVVYTGGGGGAGYNGGAGIVIIRYPNAYLGPVSVSGATATVNNGYRIYTWNSSGTITF